MVDRLSSPQVHQVGVDPIVVRDLIDGTLPLNRLQRDLYLEPCVICI